jgi:hypothetical protein
LNHTQISLDSPIIFVEDEVLEINQKAPKWSNINFSIVVNNPTDMIFYSFNVDLLINGNLGYSTTSISLKSNVSQRTNVTWKASLEGPMSFGVRSVVVDYSGNLEDHTMSAYRFLEVESSSDQVTKSSGSWTALLAILTLMSFCSYIIYTGIEDESEVIDSKSTEEEIDDDKDVEADEDLRDIAIPKDDEENEN